MANGFDIPPLCNVEKCEMPAQVYSKVSMNSKNGVEYLKTCRHHTYKDVEIIKAK